MNEDDDDDDEDEDDDDCCCNQTLAIVTILMMTEMTRIFTVMVMVTIAVVDDEWRRWLWCDDGLDDGDDGNDSVLMMNRLVGPQRGF